MTGFSAEGTLYCSVRGSPVAGQTEMEIAIGRLNQ